MLELALLILGCALATYLWRGLGMLVSGRVRMDGEFFIWAGCVAYALIAGLAVRILLLPTGTLAATPLPERLIACAIALIVYFVFRRNLLAGIAAGFVALVTLVALRSGF
ncbi:MAG: AzlD domain-containing protein [Casimicrobiaceae bacterium]